MIDVIIIGAGPAGLSASISCARFGLNVLVIDEFMKPGGRLLGQLHQEPTENGGTELKKQNVFTKKPNHCQSIFGAVFPSII